MTWVRIDESFPEHPKVSAAGGDAGWLHVCAMCYCNRFLTDGLVPMAVLSRLSDRKRPGALAAKLVEVGIWDAVDGGWQIHDFLSYQPSKAKVENERAAARERMANARGSSPDVRANKPRSSPNPSPSVSVRPVISQSSNNLSNGAQNGHEDDDFAQVVKILVEHKARNSRPDNRRAWEKTTVPNTIAEDGDQIRAELAAGNGPVIAAGNILGSLTSAELAAGRLA